MNCTRDRWIGFLFTGLCLALVPVASPRAQAQGFGPDPFRPFNSQYLQYVYPIRPETGAAAMPSRATLRGENQFQQYMNELQGASRASSETYGIGLPYWKVRSDFAQDKRDRQNRRLARANANVLGSVTRQYLTYFSEESPRKRARLLREYGSGGPAEDRELAARPGGLAGEEGAAAAADPARRGRGDAVGAAGRPSPVSTLRRSAEMSEEKGGRTIPPPPPLRSIPRDPSRSQRRPTEVLDRSHRLGDSVPDSAKTPAPKHRDREDPKPDSNDD